MGFLRLWSAFMLVVSTALSLPVSLEVKRVLDSGLANIHVTYDSPIPSEITFTYGVCASNSPGAAHHLVTRAPDCHHDRLIWRIPEDAPSGHCLSAWDQNQKLLGQSTPLTIIPSSRTTQRRLRKRQDDFSIKMDNSSGIDAEGPWFDGVAALKNKEISTVNVAAAKSKEIAIVGGGMAGLMTWMALNESGMSNMGPMRFPLSITYSSTNETLQIQDHRIVFDLAAEVNKRNNNNSNFTVSFIKWYQNSPNGLYYMGGVRKPDGQVPTLADIKANESLAGPMPTSDPMLEKAEGVIDKIVNNITFVREMAANIYKAHKTWLDDGLNGLPGDDWSEFAYLHNYLGFSLNDTIITSMGPGGVPLWDDLFESMYFAATDWRTIDGGLSRLPSAFHPLVDDVTYMNRKIQRVQYNESTERVTLQWKAQPMDRNFQNASYDYAVVTVPMPVVRTWRLPGFSPTLTAAINYYPYDQVCKVALQFKTRFWEHFKEPIYGSCSTQTDIPGIGSICYPSYDINSTGPGVMLASYTSSDDGLRWASIPEEVHVQYVVDAMAEIHGDVVYEQYTGNFNRRCWILDEYETVSWADAAVGMRKAFIPAFFNIEKGVIMSGEGTSYTSSWISSALESGVRASVQLLLELGLVDEAKAVNEKWMARWISI